MDNKNPNNESFYFAKDERENYWFHIFLEEPKLNQESDGRHFWTGENGIPIDSTFAKFIGLDIKVQLGEEYPSTSYWAIRVPWSLEEKLKDHSFYLDKETNKITYLENPENPE